MPSRPASPLQQPNMYLKLFFNAHLQGLQPGSFRSPGHRVWGVPALERAHEHGQQDCAPDQHHHAGHDDARDAPFAQARAVQAPPAKPACTAPGVSSILAGCPKMGFTCMSRPNISQSPWCSPSQGGKPSTPPIGPGSGLLQEGPLRSPGKPAAAPGLAVGDGGDVGVAGGALVGDAHALQHRHPVVAALGDERCLRGR